VRRFILGRPTEIDLRKVDDLWGRIDVTVLSKSGTDLAQQRLRDLDPLHAPANSGLVPCEPAGTSNLRWQNLPLCGAGRHEPRILPGLRPAGPIRVPASNRLWHPTTSPRGQNSIRAAAPPFAGNRGIVAMS